MKRIIIQLALSICRQEIIRRVNTLSIYEKPVNTWEGVKLVPKKTEYIEKQKLIEVLKSKSDE